MCGSAGIRLTQSVFEQAAVHHTGDLEMGKATAYDGNGYDDQGVTPIHLRGGQNKPVRLLFGDTY